MDESYLLVAARYVEMNPVAAGIVERPEEYPWSSASAHLMAHDDKLMKAQPLLSMVGNWRAFLSLSSEDEITTLRKHERSGRPLGKETFIDKVEALLERSLRPQKPGPKQTLNN